MRIKRFDDLDYDHVFNQLSDLVNLTADQKVQWVQSLAAGVSPNAAVRLEELEQQINDNQVVDNVFFHRQDDQRPNTILGNLKFSQRPTWTSDDEDYRPAALADLVNFMAEQEIDFGLTTVLKRDASVLLSGYLQINPVVEGQATFPVNLNDVFYQRPASYETLIKFMDTPLSFPNVIRPGELISRKTLFEYGLLRYSGQPIQSIGEPDPSASTLPFAYTPSLSQFTKSTHAVNVAYLNDFFNVNYNLDNYLRVNEETRLDSRLKFLRTTIDDEDDLIDYGDRFATLDNLFENLHRHIFLDSGSFYEHQELNVGYVIRRPTPQMTSNHIPQQGSRVLMRGQVVTTEDNDTVTLPDLEAAENALNAINSPSGQRTNHCSYVFINRKNFENVDWGDNQ